MFSPGSISVGRDDWGVWQRSTRGSQRSGRGCRDSGRGRLDVDHRGGLLLSDLGPHGGGLGDALGDAAIIRLAAFPFVRWRPTGGAGTRVR